MGWDPCKQFCSCKQSCCWSRTLHKDLKFHKSPSPQGHARLSSEYRGCNRRIASGLLCCGSIPGCLWVGWFPPRQSPYSLQRGHLLTQFYSLSGWTWSLTENLVLFGNPLGLGVDFEHYSYTGLPAKWKDFNALHLVLALIKLNRCNFYRETVTKFVKYWSALTQTKAETIWANPRIRILLLSLSIFSWLA